MRLSILQFFEAEGIAAGNLPSDYPILDAGILDSVRIMSLIAWVERAEQIRISDEALVPENFVTLEKIEQLIARCVGQQ